jgi:hypothetical protein
MEQVNRRGFFSWIAGLFVAAVATPNPFDQLPWTHTPSAYGSGLTWNGVMVGDALHLRIVERDLKLVAEVVARRLDEEFVVARRAIDANLDQPFFMEFPLGGKHGKFMAEFEQTPEEMRQFGISPKGFAYWCTNEVPVIT